MVPLIPDPTTNHQRPGADEVTERAGGQSVSPYVAEIDFEQ